MALRVENILADALRTVGIAGGRGRLSDGRRVFVKTGEAGVIAEEAEGLDRLASTGTVGVCEPLASGVVDGGGVLVLPWIEPGLVDDAGWRRFGTDLAALHESDAGGRYGFDGDNHLGGTAQPNGWSDDWVEFTATHRLGHQRRLAAGNGSLTDAELSVVDAVIDGLERWIPRHPRPALMHGDLWSGNAIESESGEVVLIDPACSIGDGWADIAMMRLFGGFPECCFEAYAQDRPHQEGIEGRIWGYQLYHLLNHVNLFGRSYAGQAMALTHRLLG